MIWVNKYDFQYILKLFVISPVIDGDYLDLASEKHAVFQHIT